jgi:formate dehydrogenase
MVVGTVAAGRIGTAVLRRLKPFDMKLHYTDRHRLPESIEKELGVTYHPNVESMIRVCDIVTINCPLYPETEHLFNDKLVAQMKRGAYIVNTWQDLRPRRDRPGPGERAARRLRRRRLVPATRAERPPVADHAIPWDDSPHFGNESIGTGALRRWSARSARVLV